MSGLLWLGQIVSGGLLLVFLGLHLLANHTESGLLTYEGALRRFRDPALFWTETAFLALVVFHAMNGLRGVLIENVWGVRAERAVNRAVAALGVAAVAYGVWLSTVLRLR